MDLKNPKIDNGKLFDVLSIDIINVVYDWIIGIEHNKKFKTVVSRIKMPCSTVMCMHKHNHWFPYLYFGNDLIYQERKFHWADRYCVKSP